MEPTPGAALLTTIFGCMGYFGWPKVTSPVLGGCPHGGIQCQLRLIRERQRLVGSQPTWQCLHKFELSEPVGHPAPPGLWKGRQKSFAATTGQTQGQAPYSVPLPRCQAVAAKQPLHSSQKTTLHKSFPSLPRPPLISLMLQCRETWNRARSWLLGALP